LCATEEGTSTHREEEEGGPNRVSIRFIGPKLKTRGECSKQPTARKPMLLLRLSGWLLLREAERQKLALKNHEPPRSRVAYPASALSARMPLTRVAKFQKKFFARFARA
jgi:hypothetical protein